jgi:hypothetical protein
MTINRVTEASLRGELAAELRRTADAHPHSTTLPSGSKFKSNSTTSSDEALDPTVSSPAHMLLEWVLSRPALLADHAADVELAFRSEMQSKVK